MVSDDFQKLPKADLHVHLNGLFNSQLVHQILLEEGVELPLEVPKETYLNVLIARKALKDYLIPWNYLRKIPSKIHNLDLLIKSAFCRLMIDNVKYVELRSSVIYLSALNHKSVEENMELLIDLLNTHSSFYNVEYNLILTINRGQYSLQHLHILTKAYKNIGCPEKIVALDLAGDEDIAIPNELPKQFYSSKLDFGLGVTIHAGETGNFQNIIDAVEKFGADRIGHGTAAIKSEKTIELLLKKNICLEICPISNRLTGAINKEERHPVNYFVKAGVAFVICSDNPGIHKRPLSDDYEIFYSETKDINLINSMFKNQISYSFKK